MKYLVLLLIAIFLIIPDLNGEGHMWLPHQIEKLNLKEKGLKISTEDLCNRKGRDIMKSIVYLGGATGEFVSKNGLILTNHHVAFGAIQRASDEKHDYIKNGFVAHKTGDEIRAVGSFADVLISYEEVTAKVMRYVKKGMKPLAKQKAIERACKILVRNFEKKGSDLRARVKEMYSGNAYYLFRYRRLKDIRIVLAPPRSIGNFGGDTDNWMWPRHTCDFTFLRAYVSKDGKGTAYSKENVPYKPESFLKISLDGVKEGDFTFVMGYPGSTYRNFSLQEFLKDIQNLKTSVNSLRSVLDFYVEAGRNSRAIQIKYAWLTKGLNNALKNRESKIEGFSRFNIKVHKKQSEEKLLAWMKNNKKIKNTDVIIKLNKVLDERYKLNERMRISRSVISRYLGSSLLMQVHKILRKAEERVKRDSLREPEFQKRNYENLRNIIEYSDRTSDLNVDREYLKHMLIEMKNAPLNHVPRVFRKLVKQDAVNINKYVDTIFNKTKFKDKKFRLKMLSKSLGVLRSYRDPAFKLIYNLERELKIMRKKSKIINQRYLDCKKEYLKAMLKMNDNILAPDANSTLRFTYGFVKGYNPADATEYSYRTTLKGVMEKEREEFPFKVPAKLKNLYKTADFGRYGENNKMYTCFLNTTCVTGGNSGSPVLNAKGEQIGIIFDMTKESVIGDYHILPQYLRTISVDIRYVLFITEKFSGARHLIKEMNL